MCKEVLEMGGELQSEVRETEEDEEEYEVITCPYCGWECCQCCPDCNRDIEDCPHGKEPLGHG